MGQIERHGKKNDLKRIRLTMPDGTRKRLYCGKVTQRQAEEIDRHVEQLKSRKISGYIVPDSTEHWLNNIDESLREKLVKLGLIAKRQSTTLGKFVEEYLTGRTDLKESTLQQLNISKDFLILFLGKTSPLKSINRGDAERFRLFLLDKGLSENTVRRHCGRARQFFNAAIKLELATFNPFDELKVSVNANESRFYFVSLEETEKTLAVMPDAEWRALFALCRFGGLRCVSEVMRVRWVDVHWDVDKMTVWSPKTEHHVNGASRVIPLFPELRRHLEECFDQAEPGTEYVIHKRRVSSSYLRKRIIEFVRSAGLEPWEKLFQNMRATRQTELADTFPDHVVSKWLGNSVAVAKKHYLRTTDEHFTKAIQSEVKKTDHNTAQNRTEQESMVLHGKNTVHQENCFQAIKEGAIQPCAVQCDSVQEVTKSAQSYPTRT